MESLLSLGVVCVLDRTKCFWFNVEEGKICKQIDVMPCVVVFLHSIYSNYADKIA